MEYKFVAAAAVVEEEVVVVLVGHISRLCALLVCSEINYFISLLAEILVLLE